MRDRNLCVYRKVSKIYKVFILTKDGPAFQDYSMALKYMNRFAIEEDDQFEIHVKEYKEYKKTNKKYKKTEDAIFNAAEEVILKAQQGSG